MRLLLAALMVCLAGQAAAAPRLLALCYHDVVEDPAAALADPAAVTVDTLVSHFAWLDDQGYQPITLDTWRAAADGGQLPDQPVLITFDDGYASFYEHVLPLLKLFGYPAVLAPVTSWIDAPAGSTVEYGTERVARERFMTWEQVRDAARSGLVEIASHSHDLHEGILGNPFGNTQPAAVTRRYHPDGGRYESEQAYVTRVRRDLARSVALIERHVGVPPRTMVWPYGAYNAEATAVARALGMARSLTLAELPNSPAQPDVHRRLIGSDTSLQQFVMMARDLYPPRALRAAHVDLDSVYDADPAQQAANLDRLLDRIKALRISRVFLQAFADPDGDGVADALYFPNRHLPVRADLFNRVAWQLKTRSDVQVYAWMPVLAFRLPDETKNRQLAVVSSDGSHRDRYHRLSPFHPQARRIISEIYDDLGRYSHFLGVLFHDDAFLTDSEDVSPAALEHYQRHWPHLRAAWNGSGPAADAAALVDGEAERAFARTKTKHLIELTEHLAGVLRRHQPALETARNLYARLVMEPDSEQWFAQSLDLFLDHYDYTAVMAMPYLERAKSPERWLADLAGRIARRPGGLSRTVFELQTRDWRTGELIDDAVLARHLDVLLDAGARHLAWYPDDFVAGRPGLEMLRSRVSLSDHPARLP